MFSCSVKREVTKVYKWGKGHYKTVKQTALYAAPDKAINITVLADPCMQRYYLSKLSLQNG